MAIDPNAADPWIQQLIANMDQPQYQPPAVMAPTQPAEKPKPFYDMSDPVNQMAALSAAMGMLQPIRPGQSPLGQAAQALQGGLGTMAKLKTIRRRQDIAENRNKAATQVAKQRNVIEAQKAADENAFKNDVLAPYYQGQTEAAKTKDQGLTEAQRWDMAWKAAESEYQAAVANFGEETARQMFPNGLLPRAQIFYSSMGQGDPIAALKKKYDEERAAWEKNHPQVGGDQQGGGAGATTPTTAPAETRDQAIKRNAAVPKFVQLQGELSNMRTGALFGHVLDPTKLQEILTQVQALKADLGPQWADKVDSMIADLQSSLKGRTQ